MRKSTKNRWKVPEAHQSREILAVIPQYALPYLTRGKLKVEQFQVAGFWSGIESFASGVWSGVESIGSTIGDTLWDAGGWVKDGAVGLGSWLTEWGDNTDGAIVNGATDAADATVTLGAELPSAASLVEEAEKDTGLGTVVKNAAIGVWNTFKDLVKEVGVPLGSQYLKYVLTKDILEKKMELEQKSQEQANQEAEAEAQKQYNSTMAYVEAHRDELAAKGYTPEQAVAEILYQTGGVAPQASSSLSAYLPSGITQFINQYWWVFLAGGGLLLILKD